MDKLLDFAGIRSQVDRLKERLRQVRSDIETTRRELDRIGAAPANRADLTAMVKRWAAAHREAYLADLQVTLRPFMTAAASTQALPRSEMLTLASGLPMAGAHGDGVTAVALDRVLFGLMGPQIEQALLAAIEQMPIPNEGLPWSQRAAAQSKLDAKLAELINEEDELLRSAEEAGLRLE